MNEKKLQIGKTTTKKPLHNYNRKIDKRNWDNIVDVLAIEY